MTNMRTEPQVAVRSRKEQTMSAITFEHGPTFAVGEARQRATDQRPTSQRPTAQGPSMPGSTAARRSDAPLHLTSRGRRVVTVVAIVLALAVGMIGGRAMASGPERGVEVDVYTVGTGETLWSIATAQSIPGQDVRDVVDDLMSLNELGDSSLLAGQQLLIPVTAD